MNFSDAFSALLKERKENAPGKAEALVYEAFRILYEVNGSQAMGDPEEQELRFLGRLEALPAQWCADLERARQYDDTAAAAEAETRLAAAEEILREYRALKAQY